MSDAEGGSGPEQVICPSARDPAVRWVLLALLLIGAAAWCIHDSPNYPKPEPFDLNKYLGWAFNHFLPVVLLAAAAAVIVRVVVFCRRRLVADGEGIGYAGKARLPWERITRVDARRLKSDGVLLLHAGDEVKLKLDSWRLRNFRQLVAFIERRVPAEKYVVP